MHNSIGAVFLKNILQKTGVGNIALNKPILGVGGFVPSPTFVAGVGQQIKIDNLVRGLGEQIVDEVCANKTTAASDKDLHVVFYLANRSVDLLKISWSKTIRK